VAIREKGVNVLCIAGNIGFKAKKFEYLTPEGVHFLTSGIDFESTNNKAPRNSACSDCFVAMPGEALLLKLILDRFLAHSKHSN
jgi:hypothetical protein